MNSTELWIGHGQVVLPDRVLSNGSVLIRDGKIAAIGEPCPQGVEGYDARDGYILPGFIDIHVHGGGGADFMDAKPEAFRMAAHAHALHGTTAMVPTTMTCSDELLKKVITCYLEADKAAEGCAELLGLHLEGPYFSTASKGAQPITAERVPVKEELEAIIAFAKGSILRWDAAPELRSMEMFARVMAENGILPSIAHTHADADETERAFEWGFKHVTHFYNAVTTFHKKEGIVHSGVVEATYLHDNITVELIGDGRHIPKQSMLLALRLKGSGGICLITDAMRAACTDDKHSVLGPMEGGVPVIVKDDVAQLTDLSSYAGSVCTMDRALRTAHARYGISLCEVSRMLSETPAKLCGCSHRKGSLDVGKDADVVVMTPDLAVERVWARGQAIEE